MLKVLLHVLSSSWQISSARLAIDEADASWKDKINVVPILSSWMEDATVGMGVRRKTEIFTTDLPLHMRVYFGSSYTMESSSYARSCAENIADSRNLPNGWLMNYHFWLGSCQDYFESKVGTYRDNFRVESIEKYQRVQVVFDDSASKYDPSKFLKPSVKDKIRNMTPEMIRKQYGDFIIREGMYLGGMVRRIVEVQTNSTESAWNIESSIESGMNKIDWVFGGHSRVELGWAGLPQDSRVEATVKVEGGDTSIWSNCKSVDQSRSEWLEDFSSALFDYASWVPVDFKLQPLWVLVGYFDQTKAKQMEDYYRNVVWKRDQRRIEKYWDDKWTKIYGCPPPFDCVDW